jgi:hypothetical protein
VVTLDALDQLPVPETVPTASTDARLGPHHRSSQDVIAGVPELPISATAGFFAGGVGDVVGVLTVQARDGVDTAAMGDRDLLEVLLARARALSSRVLGTVRGCAIVMAVNLLVRLAGSRGVPSPAGPLTLCRGSLPEVSGYV